jgi:hypothetical protein
MPWICTGNEPAKHNTVGEWELGPTVAYGPFPTEADARRWMEGTTAPIDEVVELEAP